MPEPRPHQGRTTTPLESGAAREMMQHDTETMTHVNDLLRLFRCADTATEISSNTQSRRKKERSKQGHTNNKHNTPKAVTFPKHMYMPFCTHCLICRSVCLRHQLLHYLVVLGAGEQHILIQPQEIWSELTQCYQSMLYIVC